MGSKIVNVLKLTLTASRSCLKVFFLRFIFLINLNLLK